MKKIVVLFLYSYLIGHAHAQPVYNTAASSYLLAVGGTPAFTDVFACSAYPAMIPFLRGNSIGLYAENKYMAEGLDLAAIALAIKSGNSGAGLTLGYFGNPFYRQVNASVAYAKSLGAINIGASLSYQVFSVRGYDRERIVSMAVSSSCKLSDKLYTSLQLSNPPFGNPISNASRQAAVYQLGLAYEVSPAVCLSIEFRKTEIQPALVCACLQYRPEKTLLVKAGFLSFGPQPFLGVGWKRKNFCTQISVSYHAVLGATPGILLEYEKKGEPALQ